MQKDLTGENVLGSLIRFALPYLLSCFLQTFYGLADLFITGQYNGTDAISAVSIGSQITHMLTVVIVGLAMGTTVVIGRAVGAGQARRTSAAIGNTISLFSIFSVFATIILIFSVNAITAAVSTPPEAVLQTRQYLTICFAGVPFITAYNVISSIFRGLGDSKSPMYFVAAAGIINIFLDFLFLGPFHMGAAGAALATVIAQAVSVLLAFVSLRRAQSGFQFSAGDLRFEKSVLASLLKVGLPIAFQDGFIQISFLVITAIANRRGVTAAASVGIVEKIICFLFLVPSAMLSSVSAVAAQTLGAGKHDRGRKALRYGVCICIAFGSAAALLCQFFAPSILGMFARHDAAVIEMGSQYLKAYVFDCVFAGVHFCFSGYFCAYGAASISFLHNLLSILLVRIPGAYLASVFFPQTLYPM